MQWWMYSVITVIHCSQMNLLQGHYEDMCMISTVMYRCLVRLSAFLSLWQASQWVGPMVVTGDVNNACSLCIQPLAAITHSMSARFVASRSLTAPWCVIHFFHSVFSFFHAYISFMLTECSFTGYSYAYCIIWKGQFTLIIYVLIPQPGCLSNSMPACHVLVLICDETLFF